MKWCDLSPFLEKYEKRVWNLRISALYLLKYMMIGKMLYSETSLFHCLRIKAMSDPWIIVFLVS
jgi:hypothetical protein